MFAALTLHAMRYMSLCDVTCFALHAAELRYIFVVNNSFWVATLRYMLARCYVTCSALHAAELRLFYVHINVRNSSAEGKER